MLVSGYAAAVENKKAAAVADRIVVADDPAKTGLPGLEWTSCLGTAMVQLRYGSDPRWRNLASLTFNLVCCWIVFVVSCKGGLK